MRILGLDPGSRVCGYGVVDAEGGELRCVECGIVTAPEGRAMEERLGEIARGLREVICEFAPAVVAVEDVFVHRNARSALALAQARGMVLAVVGLAGLRVASYPPALVKKSITGSGAASKDQIARMVQALIGLRSLPRADATDALAVALTHTRALRPTAAKLVSAVRVAMPAAPHLVRRTRDGAGRASPGRRAQDGAGRASPGRRAQDGAGRASPGRRGSTS